MKTINFKHLLTSLIAMLVSVNVNATVFSGPCGKDVSWTYDTSTTELHIRGKGEMNDLVPWSIWQSKLDGRIMAWNTSLIQLMITIVYTRSERKAIPKAQEPLWHRPRL